MPEPRTYQFDLPSSGRPTDVNLAEQWYPGVRDYWDRCTTRRTVDPINGIVAVVIHATAGSNSSGAVSVMRDGAASFHWLVPDEDEEAHGEFVWACAPEARAAWHVRNACHHPEVNGDASRVNNWSLGIEVVNRLTAADAFSAWQIEITARIVRYCWAKYPNLKHVVSHAKLDPTRRSDPGVNFSWPAFKSIVLRDRNDGVPEAARRATPLARVRGGKRSASAAGCCGFEV